MRSSKEKDGTKPSLTSTHTLSTHAPNTSIAQTAASTIKSYYPNPNLIEDNDTEPIDEPLLKGVSPQPDQRQVDPEIFKVNRLENIPIVEEIHEVELIPPQVESEQLNEKGNFKKMMVINIFSNPIFEGDVLIFAKDPKADMPKLTPDIASLSSFSNFKQFAARNFMDVLEEYSILKNGITMTVHLAVSNKSSFAVKKFLEQLSMNSDFSEASNSAGLLNWFSSFNQNIVAIIYERPEVWINPEFIPLEGMEEDEKDFKFCRSADKVFNNEFATAMFRASKPEMAEALQESQLFSEIAYGDYLQKMKLPYMKKVVYLLEKRNITATAIIAADVDVSNVQLKSIKDDELITVPIELKNAHYAILIVFARNGH